MQELKSYFQQISPVSETTFEVFVQQFEEKAYKKGDYFAKEGRYEIHFGILTKGVFRAFFRTDEGLEYNKTFFVPLSFVGAYSSLITGQKNLINIQCLTDCHLLVADYPNIVKLYKTTPEIETFSRRLSELYFVQKERREIELVLLTADKRYELFKKEFPNLHQLIPQYHIASYLGITPTQLSRIRKNKNNLST